MRREAANAYSERLNEMLSAFWNIQLKRSCESFQFKYFQRSFTDILQELWASLKCVPGFVSFLIWGFGERPTRIVATAFVVIFTYVTLFYCSNIEHASGEFFNSLYLSIVTFTTLGFGDITPIKAGAFSKFLVASEALIGVFLMGLLVAGYSNKARY